MITTITERIGDVIVIAMAIIVSYGIVMMFCWKVRRSTRG